MKNLTLIILAVTLLTSFVFAENNEAYNAVFIQQEMLQNEYKEAQLSMVDINKTEALKAWYRLYMKEPSHVVAYKKIMKSARKTMLGKDYRNLLYYLTVTGQHQQAAHVVGLYALSARALVDNISKDPQTKFWKADLLQELRAAAKGLGFGEIKKIVECYREQVKSERGFSIDKAHLMRAGLRVCLKSSSEMTMINLGLKYAFESEKYSGAPFPITYAGYIEGNKVDLFNDTNTKPSDAKFVAQQLDMLLKAKAPGAEKLYQNMTIDDFKAVFNLPEDALTKVFTEEEGFKYGDEHAVFAPISGNRYGIYGEILKSIENAKESVMIDMFWIGGTIGINLAKTLMKKVIENPEFKVYIVSDNENRFGYASELDFVYNYMRAFSEKFTSKHFYIAPANVGLKRTALPEFIDLLITDSTVTDIQNNSGLKELLEQDGFHLLAKSDHTKVFVVDGLNPDLGKAYVGSKNWTDSSGAVNIDEVVKVQGPAVQVILNSFYYDLLEAYGNKKEAAGTAGGIRTTTLMRQHIQAKFPRQNRNFKQGLKQLLRGVDVLGRYRYRNPISYLNVSVPYKALGDSVVAPAQNNIYGTEVSAVEQNVQAILSAQKQILIDDQFLYDPQVIEALKVAVTKNKVKVYALIETLQAVDAVDNVAAHIPNNLFVPDLVALGIPVKWMLTGKKLKEEVIASNKEYGRILSTTFHVKSIGIDGVLAEDQASCQSFDGAVISTDDKAPLLISGSANKDVMTMSGGFREYQVAAYDAKVTARHDCLFWGRWNSASAVSTDGLDFEIPEQIVETGVTDKKRFLEGLKIVLFSTYNFTKDFFN